MENYQFTDRFIDRHIGPSAEEINAILDVLGEESVDSMISKTIPEKIRLADEMKLDTPLTEAQLLDELAGIAAKNKVFRSFIGMGYYCTITPSVIRRNILENPGWYTQYTPYQAEISQGRLEALLNFQTMISDLTSLPLANASLLDEATAAAEAMAMFFSLRKKNKKKAHKFFVADSVFPQTVDVMITRAKPLGIEIVRGSVAEFGYDEDVYGMLLQYPDDNGEIIDYSEAISKAKENEIFVAVATDLMALTMLTPPGEMGADAALGSAQRFGVPMGYGGPHAAFFATREEYKRNVPGRIIGVSQDSNGKPALRMALQTREQHIKRERATSNICTAQVLLAIMASMYAVYHGPEGLKNIASRINKLTAYLAGGIKKLGYPVLNENFFDTIRIGVENKTDEIKEKSLNANMNFRYFNNGDIGISLDESSNFDEVKNILALFAEVKGEKLPSDFEIGDSIPAGLIRNSEYLNHPVFNSYFSETEMMRYIKKLERKDLSLTTSMIPLGSCTMKLNAATEMLGITWPEFSSLHPFVPRDQAEGYTELFNRLEEQIKNMTGFSAVSLQPNSGAQGEFTGLMVIRKYQVANGEGERNICLIPSSAHGTNPASAVMAGCKVVIVKCDEKGNIDIDDLKKKAEENSGQLSSLMVTYPSTHGVFEQDIKEICAIIHDNGGQVYMDGANLNAQVGLTNPGVIGADVCHLNLHKTFSIPHGGGGPGMGPIAVASHLAPHLPGHCVVTINGEQAINAVSAAPWGSANVLVISYAYIRMMGAAGLKKASEIAILNANYIKNRLGKYFPVLYTGVEGFVGHEMILDLRGFKAETGIEVEDVAKRLMDYNYHAPTVSFPVPGTLMVEPTESESKAEMDRFCDAMISIYNEIREIADGSLPKDDNPLINAPHTAGSVLKDNWTHPYSRERAAFPMEWIEENKFWPASGRVDNAYGDRNLVCSCLPVSEYEE